MVHNLVHNFTRISLGNQGPPEGKARTQETGPAREKNLDGPGKKSEPDKKKIRAEQKKKSEPTKYFIRAGLELFISRLMYFP